MTLWIRTPLSSERSRSTNQRTDSTVQPSGYDTVTLWSVRPTDLTIFMITQRNRKTTGRAWNKVHHEICWVQHHKSNISVHSVSVQSGLLILYIHITICTTLCYTTSKWTSAAVLRKRPLLVSHLPYESQTFSAWGSKGAFRWGGVCSVEPLLYSCCHYHDKVCVFKAKKRSSFVFLL